jgi:hypothetical protein
MTTSKEKAAAFRRQASTCLDVAELVQLPNYRVYLKLMIDGSPSKPFSGVTFPPTS